jgi:hypothetical protein
MWEIIKIVVSQWGLAGVMLVGIVFFIYILYVDKNKQAAKDTLREERLNQITDKIITITGDVSKVVGANTEVFREVSQRLVELKDNNIVDHKYIVDKIDKLDANSKIEHDRLEDKITDFKKRG